MFKRGFFFGGHKREDVVECQGIFLEKIKALLSYFVEFKENGTILPKKYPDDCAIGGSN